MSRAERSKGLRGEREVFELWQRHGFEVRGLEATGDHLAIRRGLLIHGESKRQEVARPWLWWEQASTETPDGALTVVAFRRSRSPWLALCDLDALAGTLERLTV